jgi:hypothetical protein
MWFLVVFYIGNTTPPTLEMFHMKDRDSCKQMEATTIKMLSEDPTIGIKHKTMCRKIDVA